MTLPARAERTGTAVRPRPGSKASRTPTVPGTDPVLLSTRGSRDGRPAATGLGDAERPGGLGGGPPAAGLSTRQRQQRDRGHPGPEDGQVDLDAWRGSTARAGPIGISGEAATAMTTASSAPVTVTTASRARDSVTRVARVAPKARSTGNSADSSASCLASSWPSTASAIRPASAAKAASATACGRAACSSAVTWSAWLITSIRPPVPGWLAVPLYLASQGAGGGDEPVSCDAPGRSRTAAWSP